MPSSFHTKTIESILDPVAQQVSELVVLHEKGEDGAAMPNIAKQINAVNAAVNNLATVGNQQIETTKDVILKLDTPPTLEKLVRASTQLVDSTDLFTSDSYSKVGREKLIRGARGILQGTSDILIIFDDAEVRRIIKICKNVRDYLDVSKVVQGMEDLVTYVKSITPGVTNMSNQVNNRASDLTNQIHADKLKECITSLREQLPNFISSIKLVVATVNQPDTKANEAAGMNRMFYVKNIAEVITEIIKYLQMKSADINFQTDPIDITRLQNTKDDLKDFVESGKQWLSDPNADPDSDDKLKLQQALDVANEIATQTGNQELADAARNIQNKIDRLAQLRKEGKGNSPEALKLASEIASDLDKLAAQVDKEIDQMVQCAENYNVIKDKLNDAKEWLADPDAKPGVGTGSEAIGIITEKTRHLAKTLPKEQITSKERAQLLDLCDEIDDMMKQMNQYRENGQGHTQEARNLAKKIGEKLNLVNGKVNTILSRNKSPETLKAKLLKAKKWMENPAVDDGGEGQQCTRKIINEARQIAGKVDDDQVKKKIMSRSEKAEQLCNELDEMFKQGLADTENARDTGKEAWNDMEQLEGLIKKGMAGIVADEFADSTLALKQLNAAAVAPIDTPNRNEKYEQRAEAFETKAKKLAKLGKQAIAQSSYGAEDKLKQVDAITKNINALTPQVITAGRIVLLQPDNQLAKDHFKSLQDEWSDNMEKLTQQVDDTIDVADFLKSSEQGIIKEKKKCVEAMEDKNVIEALNTAGNIAKRAERVVQAGKHEIDNVEDATYVSELKAGVIRLHGTIPKLVSATRGYAQSRGNDPDKKQDVEDKVTDLLSAVSDIRTTVEGQKISQQMMNDLADFPPPAPPAPPVEELPAVPPLPEDSQAPDVPPLPQQEEEEEFPEIPDLEDEKMRDHKMMEAAKDLHETARQWESQGNDIIAAAKKMALMMAKMSNLVNNPDAKKSDLIQCAKDIAKASNEVTKLAKQVANKCTDKRIRNDMLKTLERIPTISTQLRILSTVKAASLGESASMTKDDLDAAQQATDLLVHNAENLMMSVKDTVKYAEAASIRIRTDAGIKMRWVRRV